MDAQDVDAQRATLAAAIKQLTAEQQDEFWGCYAARFSLCDDAGEGGQEVGDICGTEPLTD